MPLSLSDDEFAAVQAVAAPIHPLQRGAFLEALAKALEGHAIIGPGLVHRLAAELQRRYVVEAQRETSHSAGPEHFRARQAGTLSTSGLSSSVGGPSAAPLQIGGQTSEVGE
jgi:hypothetical protein